MRPVHVRRDDVDREPTRHGSSVLKQVFVRGGVLPDVTQVAVAVLDRTKDDVELHKHPTMWECYFCIEGRAVYTVGDEQIEMRPGDFLAIPPDTMHNQRVIDETHTIFYWGISVG
ncbi:MAG: cupin domain-containing protein [Patescibacteria group bacterium]